MGGVFMLLVGCGPGGAGEPPEGSESSGVLEDGPSNSGSTGQGDESSDSSSGAMHETDCEGAVVCEVDWLAGEIEGEDCPVYAIQQLREVRFTVLDPDEETRGEDVFVDPVLEVSWRAPFDSVGPTGVVLQCNMVRQAEFRTCVWIDCLDPYSWWTECEEVEASVCP
jgi:hypothetical protein